MCPGWGRAGASLLYRLWGVAIRQQTMTMKQCQKRSLVLMLIWTASTPSKVVILVNGGRATERSEHTEPALQQFNV
ncbi:hypothetical protein EV361DRAFT_39897 [Lentinula raphanica]|nr:hypothetical protein EV361DRAFT_39897 [Lentinula raphanica]